LFLRKTPFFRLKMAKIAENYDHNIDPRFSPEQLLKHFIILMEVVFSCTDAHPVKLNYYNHLCRFLNWLVILHSLAGWRDEFVKKSSKV
jgi:hypothetical protein